MGTDTVKEPTVMRDNHRTSGKLLKTFLKSTKGIYVDIVGRLVKEKNVTLLLQSHSEMQTVTLTTREHAAFLLLIGT